MMSDKILSTKEKMTEVFSSILNYYLKVKSSDNYLDRCIHAIFMIQALFLSMFVFSRILIGFEAYTFMSFTTFVFFIIGLIFIYDMLAVTVSTKAGSYFLSAIVYFLVSVTALSKILSNMDVDNLTLSLLDASIALHFGTLTSFINILLADSFLGSLALWNLLFATAILAAVIIRTFILGLKFDYQNEDSQDENTEINAN